MAAAVGGEKEDKGMGQMVTDLTRLDIYRQRVFGPHSAQEDTVAPSTSRKRSQGGMLAYCVFIAAATYFSWMRIDTQINQQVLVAAQKQLASLRFANGPILKQFSDIATVQDMSAFLMQTFPTIGPGVLGTNPTVSPIRFTARRIKLVNNTDPRFNALVPMRWANQFGIRPSSDLDTSNEDTAQFGIYRAFFAHQPDPKILGLEYCAMEQAECSASTYMDWMEWSVMYDRTTIVNLCNDWCANLVVNSQPCNCWTLSNGLRCEFFSSPQASLLNGSDCHPGDPRPIMKPPLITEVLGSTAYYPLMLQFQYNSSQAGWDHSPGVVLKLRRWNPTDLDKVWAMQNGDPGQAPTVVDLVGNQIQDWIVGGLLNPGLTALTIDMVMYNPLLMACALVKFQFTVSASGAVTPKMSCDVITAWGSDIFQKATFLVSGGILDYIFLGMLLIYIGLEVFEFFQQSPKTYIVNGGNLLVCFNLLLNALTVLAWAVYLDEQTLQTALKGSGDDFTLNDAVQDQVDALVNFRAISGVALIATYSQLAVYLNDIFPRVRVLVTTMSNATTPVILLVIICGDVYVGFVIWAYLMYGTSVTEFSTFGESATSCMELLFGSLSSYDSLNQRYGFSGFIFFALYMIMFFFILTAFSKAIILLAFDDASKAFEEELKTEQEKEEKAKNIEDRSFLGLAQALKDMKWKAKDISKAQLEETRKLRPNRVTVAFDVLAFGTYLVMYVLVVYYIIQVNVENPMASMVKDDFNLKGISQTQEVADLSYQTTFESMVDPADVMPFFRESLPQILFGSSQSDFINGPNPLKFYSSALPAQYGQVAYDDWNILIGQTPVRMSFQYNKMKNITIMNFTLDYPEALLYAGSVTKLEDILDDTTSSMLSKYCNYTTSYGALSRTAANGWACMLSADQQSLSATLADMEQNLIVTDQTSQVALDFVLYNGNVGAFMYVAVIIQMQPNGVVTTSVQTMFVSLGMYNMSLLWRLILELIALAFAVVHVGYSTFGVIQAARLPWKQRLLPTSSRWQGVVMTIYAMLNYILMDIFNIMEIVSSVLTVVTLLIWYSIQTSSIQNFYFPERPGWDHVLCQSYQVCTDSDVLFWFSQAGLAMQSFKRVAAINTILLFLRFLRLLRNSRQIRMLINTLTRSGVDIAWFLILVVVFLLGYVMFARLIFGPKVSAFQDLPNSFISCFLLYTGNFDLNQLRDVSALAYFFFSITYIILFRYLMGNMFFAILFMNLRKEEEQMLAEEEAEKQVGGGSTVGQETILQQVKGLKSHILPCLARAPQEATAELSSSSPKLPEPQTPAGAESVPTEMEELPGGPVEAAAEPAALHATPHFQSCVDMIQVSRSANWNLLPDAIKEWAEQTAHKVDEFVHKQLQTQEKDTPDEHKKGEGSKQPDFERSRIQQEAESEIKKMLAERATEATRVRGQLEYKELRSLKAVHQDQESLAWYIMKREKELEKLKESLQEKQTKFDHLQEASRILVSGEPQAAQEALTSLLEDGA